MYLHYILHASSIIKFKILHVKFESILMDPSLLPRGEGRDDKIGTRDILYPKQRRYQAAPHPFQLVYDVIVENLCPVFHIVISSIDIQFLLPFLLFLFLLIYILNIIPPLLPTLTYLCKRLKKISPRGFPDRNSCMRGDPNSVYPVKQALPPASTQTKNMSA